MKIATLALLVILLPRVSLGQSVVNLNLASGVDPTDARQLADERTRAQELATLRVSRVVVKGRWAASVSLPLAPGDLVTREKIFEAMEALRSTITNDSVYGYGLRSKGQIGILWIDVDFAENPDPAIRDVVVTFNPFYVQLSLDRVGDNVLPIPRSARPSFFNNVPKPLLAFQPTMGLSSDRTFGTAIGGAMRTSLLTVRDPARINQSSSENAYADLQAEGMRSVNQPFYRADANVRIGRRQHGGAVQDLSLLRVEYEARREPMADASHRLQAGIVGGGVTLKLAPNTRLSLDPGYRRTDEDTLTSTATLSTSTNEQTNRVLLDTIPPRQGGFLRAALWENNGWVVGGGTYQRLVGRIGYAKEIPVGISQTLGFDVIAGFGTTFGTGGDAHFFGGAPEGQFLYDGPASAALLRMPTGPVLRSFGRQQAGLRTTSGATGGGDSFWHVNANLAIPVRKWSRAVIPNEVTDLPDSSGRPLTLKQLLNKQIDVSGPSMLESVLKREGMPPADAKQKAKEIIAEVQPATHYIIDDASLFSIKPLVMFDAVGMNDGLPGGVSSSWVAAGVGVQLMIVTAKCEVGYMRTMFGPAVGQRGTVSARVVFQNLF
jgi:hypothetical protein